MARHDLPRTKTPTEKFRIAVDFKNDIKLGDTRLSQTVTAFRMDTLAATPAVIGAVVASGTLVEVVVQAGTDGLTYGVLFQITTTQGDVFEALVVVPVRAN